MAARNKASKERTPPLLFHVKWYYKSWCAHGAQSLYYLSVSRCSEGGVIVRSTTAPWCLKQGLKPCIEVTPMNVIIGGVNGGDSIHTCLCRRHSWLRLKEAQDTPSTAERHGDKFRVRGGPNVHTSRALALSSPFWDKWGVKRNTPCAR